MEKSIFQDKLFGYREMFFIKGENLPTGVEHFLGLPQAHPEEHKDKDLNYEVCVNETVCLSLYK